MTRYEAFPEHDVYAPEEEIRLRLRITNRAAAPLDLPDPSARGTQPTYTVRGLDFEKVFSTDSLLKNPFEQQPPPPPRIQVHPGDTWEGTVALRGLSVEAPGDYQLTSRLQLASGEAVSEPRPFRVTPVVPADVHLGTGLRPFGNAEGEVALLHRSGTATLLYTARYFEPRPDIGEPSLNAPVLRLVLGPDARDVSVPWKNTPFGSEMEGWVVWREGARVSALSSSGTKHTVALPSEPRALIRPPLKEKDGSLDVLALAASGKELQLSRFGVDGGKLAWAVALPAVVESAVAALGPAHKGNVRHLAFASHTGRGIAIHHTRFTSEGAPDRFESVSFEPIGPERKPPRLLSGSTPALNVDGKGVAWAGFLATSGDEALWLEARFARGLLGSDNDIRATVLGPLSSMPLRGALLYADDKDGSIVRREVVLLLESGKLVRLKDGVLQELSVQGVPTMPLLLAPGRNVTYVLYADKVRGPYLERM